MATGKVMLSIKTIDGKQIVEKAITVTIPNGNYDTDQQRNKYINEQVEEWKNQQIEWGWE